MSAQWASPVLADAYHKIDGMRRDLAQPADSTIDGVLRDLLDQIEAADTEMEAVAHSATEAERQEDLNRAALKLRTGFREEDFA